jgi:hypothetical protein
MKKGLSIGITAGVSIFVIIVAVILISSPKSDVKDAVITPITNVTTNVQIVNNQTLNVETEIQKKLDEIEKINLENKYSPKEREWQTSGPFQIDRKQYAIGEKIFLIIGGLNADEKGQITFMRPLNATHYSVYLSIPFDGAAKPEFNYYLEPKLSKASGICSVDDLIGKWVVVFRGTDYPNIYFEITKDGFVPGTDIEPVC